MKAYIGKVVSNKMTGTVVVERDIFLKHPLYKKIMRRTRRIKAHTDIPLNVGDRVKCTSTRPLSKETHYKVVEKIA